MYTTYQVYIHRGVACVPCTYTFGLMTIVSAALGTAAALQILTNCLVA